MVGVPDSFVVEINGQQYRRNKHGITFSPPKDDDGGAVGGTSGNQHAEEQVGTENKTDRLRPRPTLKFPRIPTEETLHSDFNLLFKSKNKHVCANSTVRCSNILQQLATLSSV